MVLFRECDITALSGQCHCKEGLREYAFVCTGHQNRTIMSRCVSAFSILVSFSSYSNAFKTGPLKWDKILFTALLYRRATAMSLSETFLYDFCDCVVYLFSFPRRIDVARSVDQQLIGQKIRDSQYSYKNGDISGLRIMAVWPSHCSLVGISSNTVSFYITCSRSSTPLISTAWLGSRLCRFSWCNLYFIALNEHPIYRSYRCSAQLTRSRYGLLCRFRGDRSTVQIIKKP